MTVLFESSLGKKKLKIWKVGSFFQIVIFNLANFFECSKYGSKSRWGFSQNPENIYDNFKIF